MKFLIPTLLLIIILLQLKLWFGDGSILEVHEYQTRIIELKKEKTRLRERNQALEAEVLDLKKGKDAVEERARRDLGMIRKGETFF
ncbi:MAG: septum formation initiator family protein, partial [Pseudomonadota bacterium]